MIVILDLGSHENTVLARAIRALGVYSEIYPHDITAQELKALPNVKGVIINGGPNNVIDGTAIDVNPEIYNAGFPVMAAGHDKALCDIKLPQITNDVEATKEAVKSFVFDTCKAFLRTMPLLVYDPHTPEDVDSSGEDHVADEVRYMCMLDPISPPPPEVHRPLPNDPLEICWSSLR